MKTLVLQVATPEVDEYFRYIKPINKDYARIYGYDYHVATEVSRDRHPSWGKIEHTINKLPYYDRIFVLDADAFVNNRCRSLDSLSLTRPINVCDNGPNGGELANCGVLVFINTPITLELLNTWYKTAEGTDKMLHGFWEQDIFNSLHNSGKDVPLDSRFSEHTQVFRYNVFNSWWLDISHDYKKEQFVQHIMARSIQEKVDIMKKYLNLQ